MAGPLPTPRRVPADDAEATREYYARERLGSLYDPAEKLDLVARFAADSSDNPIAVLEHFPVKSRPSTFALDIRPTALANGVLFEFGTSARGMCLAIEGADLYFAMGQPSTVPGKGCSHRMVGACPAGVRSRIVVACLPDGPGGATFNVWVDGVLRGAAQSIDTDLGGPNLGSANGGVGAVGVDGVIDRIPAAQRVDLVNCEIITPLRQYGYGTLPQQFDNALSLGTDITGDADFEYELPARVLTVGSAGFLRGFRPADHPTNQFGTLAPDTFESERVWQLSANVSTNVVVLEFGVGGSVQIPGATTLQLRGGFVGGVATLTWNGTTRYEATDANVATWLDANVGAAVEIGIRR